MFKTEAFGIDPLYEKTKGRILAFYLGKSNCLVRGERRYLSADRAVTPYLTERGTMLPVSLFTELYGAEALSSLATEDRGGVAYAPASDICSLLSLYLHEEINGLTVITDTDMSQQLDWVKNMRFMRNIVTAFSYDDVTGEEMLEMIRKRHPNASHPRMILTEERFFDIRRRLAESSGDPVLKKLYATLVGYAEEYLTLDPVPYGTPDGIRLLEVCRENTNRMMILAMVYNLSGDERYAEGAYRVLSHCCAFPDFNPYHFLDVGEMGARLALTYDWLYNWMDADQRAFVRNALVEKAIDPIIEDFDDLPRRRSWNWRGELADNWRLVIAGVGLAAIAIMDELEGDALVNAERAAEQTLYDIRRALALFAPFGAYEEGHGYWYFAMLYYTYYVGSLLTVFGTDFGYVDVVGMRMTNDYMLAMNGPVSTFDYHDCPQHKRNIPPQMMFLADYFSRPEQAIPRIDEIMSNERIGALECISDMLFYKPEFLGVSRSDTPPDLCLPVAEVASMRTGTGREDMWLGFHCDDPIGGEGHDHMDSGTFVLDALGESFIFDLGRDDYNLSDYLNCYRVRDEGHNLVVLNPDAGYSLKWGGTARICDFGSSKSRAYAVGELSRAYRDGFGVKSYLRGAMLLRDEHISVVRDELELTDGGELYWFAHTRAVITVSEDGRSAALTLNGKRLYARILSGDATFSVMEAVPLKPSPKIEGQNPNEGVRKLTVHIPRVKKIALTVAFAQSERALDGVKINNIENWKKENENA